MRIRLAPGDSRLSDKCRAYCSVCNSLPGLKRTALPGGIATSAPVRGLRPMPVLRGRTLKMPKPRSSMRSPLSQSPLHAFKDGLDGHLGLRLGDARSC